MDIFLFGTSASLSAYLPRYLFDLRTEQVTMFVSMGVSLSLFSLTFLEAMPKSTMMLLSSATTMEYAYWVLLGGLSIHILMILPSFAGASVAQSLGEVFCPSLNLSSFNVAAGTDRDDRKYPMFCHLRSCPWWIRLFIGFLQIFFNALYRAICYFGDSRRFVKDSPELVMTVHDEKDLLTVTSGSSDKDVRNSPSRRSASIISIAANASNLNGSSSSSSSARLRARKRVLAAVGSVTGVVSTIFILAYIGPVVVQTPSDGDTTVLSRVISWLCAVGLLLSSLLNGFGSVSLPFTYLSGIFLQPLRPEAMNRINSELRSMQDALAKKRTALKEITVEIALPSTRTSGVSVSTTGRSSTTSSSKGGLSTNSSFMALNSAFSDLKEDIGNRRQILQTEIEFLEDLIREMSLDIEELRYSQSMAAAARTRIGRIKSCIGMGFSIVLLVRLLNAAISIWSSSAWQSDTTRGKTRHDIVTTILLWLTGRDYISHDRYTMLSQVVSLVLTAVLSFTQVRTFLRIVAIVNRRLSKVWNKCACCEIAGTNDVNGNNGGNDDRTVSFHSQIIAGFLGCYSIACIVLIKMMVPAKYSISFSAALGETDIFTIHAAVVNVLFLSSAVASSAILGMLLGIQRQNNLRHAAAAGGNDKAYYGPDV